MAMRNLESCGCESQARLQLMIFESVLTLKNSGDFPENMMRRQEREVVRRSGKYAGPAKMEVPQNGKNLTWWTQSREAFPEEHTGNCSI